MVTQCEGKKGYIVFCLEAAVHASTTDQAILHLLCKRDKVSEFCSFLHSSQNHSWMYHHCDLQVFSFQKFYICNNGQKLSDRKEAGGFGNMCEREEDVRWVTQWKSGAVEIL